MVSKLLIHLKPSGGLLCCWPQLLAALSNYWFTMAGATIQTMVGATIQTMVGATIQTMVGATIQHRLTVHLLPVTRLVPTLG